MKILIECFFFGANYFFPYILHNAHLRCKLISNLKYLLLIPEKLCRLEENSMFSSA